MGRLLLLMAGLAGVAASALATDFNCMEGCFRQGHARSHCVAVCGGGPGPGMLDQPGMPRNPAFDQMEQQSHPQQRPLAPVVDPRCLDACRKRGFNYSLCRQQCAYGGGY